MHYFLYPHRNITAHIILLIHQDDWISEQFLTQALLYNEYSGFI